MDTLLPSIPSLLVLAVLEDGPAHGYQIVRRVEEESGGLLALKEGTLYPRLYQLERDGLIQGTWQDIASRRVKLYALTPKGTRALATQRAQWEDKAMAVNRVLFRQGGPLLEHP
ncbi:PadR family transcriptional regulator [Sulfobacillus harzensis]|uniref:PadR family transcriptional regulator n=1 Tax=Sulfobacillus harzensis TaxID=2729629 RepID=A0A7Y0L5L1_9FIRM|nr:helix-turn-helix transcriptional regulator [Sulfobacillus harzensis]NMP23156.1 PadR family transcriptional regulator [Sulfobacillus harzensis]